MLLSEEGGTGEAKSEGCMSGVDKSDQRFSTLFFNLWTSSQENCAKLPLQGSTLWKLLEGFFCFYFVISNHTDYFTCFSNIAPSPRAVIPRMGSGQVLPVREKGFWSHSDLSLNPSCTNIYLPCSICFCGMWDYQYLSFRGMVGIKLDDVCKPPAQLQTVNRSQLFLLLLPNSVGPFGYNGLETS